MTDTPKDRTQEVKNAAFPTNWILIAIGILLIITAITLYPEARRRLASEKAMATNAAIPTSQFLLPTPTEQPDPTADPEPTSPNTPEFITYPNQFGTLILSIREGKDIHLFAYQPFLEGWEGEGFGGLPLTRLTTGPYQDITPDISSDGSQIAFASNRNGPWDIYIMDVQTGEIKQFTNTAAYDANPSWSPDNQWLAYESYQINNLDILIQDVGKTNGPIPLVKNPAADFAPDWSSEGRRISFISDRSGKQEVWYADLDSPEEDKAIQIKNLPGQQVQHPSWSGDGRFLTWGIITSEGSHSLVTWDSQDPDQDPVYAGTGDWPLWGGDTGLLYAALDLPHQTYLTAYPGNQDTPQLMLPAVRLPGPVEGISWTPGNHYQVFTFLEKGPDPTPLWVSSSANSGGSVSERKSLLEIPTLSAPSPVLSEEAIPGFNSLRAAVIQEAGWDFLSDLENAYVPLNLPLPPGVNLDWLFTGRGIMINDIPRLADWLVLVKNDYGCQTYWKVYIKAYNQQGSQGRPLHANIWDLDARYSGNNADYENGGGYSSSIPSGYWVDFTALAEAYGWMNFPAESYWQFSEKASRYQYYAFTQGLPLEWALLELYSPGEIQGQSSSANP